MKLNIIATILCGCLFELGEPISYQYGGVSLSNPHIKKLRYTQRPAIWRSAMPFQPSPTVSPEDAVKSRPKIQQQVIEPKVSAEDMDIAASEHGHHHGRVHIKVFRGPDDHHDFAPHGYWIKQPADDDRSY